MCVCVCRFICSQILAIGHLIEFYMCTRENGDSVKENLNCSKQQFVVDYLHLHRIRMKWNAFKKKRLVTINLNWTNNVVDKTSWFGQTLQGNITKSIKVRSYIYFHFVQMIGVIFHRLRFIHPTKRPFLWLRFFWFLPF